jgi:hypothetical protein
VGFLVTTEIVDAKLWTTVSSAGAQEQREPQDDEQHNRAANLVA